MLVHSLAPKYERFVVLARLRYWTPPIRPFDPPLLKSDDLFFREPRDIGPPPFKNPGHAPDSFLGSTPGVPNVVDNLCLSDVTHYMYIYSKAEC